MKSAKLLLFPIFALILSGCAGYHVGSTLDPAIKTVSLSVVNATADSKDGFGFEPSIEVAVMKALRAELQMDGRLQVCSAEQADSVLTVRLTRFNLDPLAYDRRHGSFAEEYRATITASVVFSKAETGEVIHENPSVTGDSEFAFESDLTSAKSSAIRAASTDLARKAVNLTVNGW